MSLHSSGRSDHTVISWKNFLGFLYSSSKNPKIKTSSSTTKKTDLVVQTPLKKDECDTKEFVATFSFSTDPIQFSSAFQKVTGLLPDLINIISQYTVFPTKFSRCEPIQVPKTIAEGLQKQKDFETALQKMIQSTTFEEQASAIYDAQTALSYGRYASKVTKEQLLQLSTNNKQLSLDFLFAQKDSLTLTSPWIQLIQPINQLKTDEMRTRLPLLHMVGQRFNNEDRKHIREGYNSSSVEDWWKANGSANSYDEIMLGIFCTAVNKKDEEIQSCFRSNIKIIHNPRRDSNQIFDDNLPIVKHCIVKCIGSSDDRSAYLAAIELLKKSNKKKEDNRTNEEFEMDRKINLETLESLYEYEKEDDGRPSDDEWL